MMAVRVNTGGLEPLGGVVAAVVGPVLRLLIRNQLEELTALRAPARILGSHRWGQVAKGRAVSVALFSARGPASGRQNASVIAEHTNVTAGIA
jgi:hypothetical protein